MLWQLAENFSDNSTRLCMWSVQYFVLIRVPATEISILTIYGHESPLWLLPSNGFWGENHTNFCYSDRNTNDLARETYKSPLSTANSTIGNTYQLSLLEQFCLTSEEHIELAMPSVAYSVIVVLTVYMCEAHKASLQGPLL